MTLSPGQSRLAAAIAAQRAERRPVRILYLKARRVHATTGAAAHFFQHTAFNPGVHTVVLAHDHVSVSNIFRIYKRFHEHYRPFDAGLLPPRAKVLSGSIVFAFGNDPESSWIKIHTANNPDFGRSFRLTNVHFSEFPYYDHPADTLSSVMSAVPKQPDTCVIIEGTAKTIGDHFHRMWQSAVDGSGEAEWRAVFMGWWEHPGNRMDLDNPARFERTLTDDERELMARHSLTLQQLAWRRFTIGNDFAGDLHRFRREHPATPEEAFTASSRNRFSLPHLQRMPVQSPKLCGALEPRQVGLETRYIFQPNETGVLRIWKLPEKGRLYVIGVDSSQGVDVNLGRGDWDPDWSVAQVFDRDTGEQCALLRARITANETGRAIANLGRYYQMAQICAERNGGGISMLETLLHTDYPHALLYHHAPGRPGWETTSVSRPQLLCLLDDAIRQLSIVVHDPVTMNELLTFVITPKGRAEAQSGCHDDCVIALALAVVAIDRMPRPKPLAQNLPPPRIQHYGRRRF